jgi:hypothetical protein
MAQIKVYRLNFASYLYSLLFEILVLLVFAYFLISVTGISGRRSLNLLLAIFLAIFFFILKWRFNHLWVDENQIKIKKIGQSIVEINWQDISKAKAKIVSGPLRAFKASYLEIFINANRGHKVDHLNCFENYEEFLSQLRFKLGDKLEIMK